MPESVRAALDANGMTTDDIDLLVAHQANLRINQMVASSSASARTGTTTTSSGSATPPPRPSPSRSTSACRTAG
jgi:3-oxoacyl-[acyl-carrier-protein] synthase III